MPAVSLLLPVIAHAQAAPRPLARLLVTSGVEGEFARPVCDSSRSLAPGRFALPASALEWQQRASDRPLIVDTGGLLAPRGVVHFALKRAPQTLATLVQKLGYRALALGADDLQSELHLLVSMVRTLRARGIPVIASNLHCSRGTSELCQHLVDAADGVSLHAVGSMHVAVVSLLTPRALLAVSRDLGREFRVEEPARALGREVREARALGADLVVATLDTWRSDDAASRLLALADELPDDGRPDLLFASTAGRQLLFARTPKLRPALLGTSPGSVLEVHVRPATMGTAHDLLARPALHGTEPAPAVKAWMDAVGRRYCREWARALPGAALRTPLSPRELLNLSGQVTRALARAEVAVLEQEELVTDWKPVSKHSLTRSDLEVALRWNQPLVLANVPAGWLAQVATLTEAKQLRLVGLQGNGDDLRIAGHKADPRDRYRVVASRFAAHEHLPPGVDWQPFGFAPSRTRIRRYLSMRRHADPRETLPAPDRSTVWTYRIDAETRLAGTAVHHQRTAMAGMPAAPSYEAAQLNRQESLTLGGRTQWRLDAAHRNWALELLAMGRYQTTRALTERLETTEGDDLLSARATFHWRGLRRPEQTRYVPDPYVEGYLESEFTLPGSETRKFRHMLLRPTVGLGVPLSAELTIKLATGLETQLLDPARRALPGAGLEVVLKPWVITQGEERKVELEASANYFASDWLGKAQQTLRGHFSAKIELTSLLALKLGIDLYAEDQAGKSLAVASNFTTGLNMSWFGRASKL